MKIYGYDDTGAARGELLAAQVDARDLDFGLDALACEFGWERAFTSFREAQRALVEQMSNDGADPELIQTVRSFKASYVPVTELEV